MQEMLTKPSMVPFVLKMPEIQSTGPGQTTRGHGKEAVINVDL